MKKFCQILIGCTMITASLSACTSGASALNGSGSSTEGTVTDYTFNKKLVSVTGNEAEDFAADFADSGYAENAEVNEDGSVTVALTEDENAWWLEKMEDNLKDLADRIANQGENFSLTVADDHQTISLSMDYETAHGADGVADILGAETYCAEYQVLSGTEDWYVKIEICNSETGILVKEGDSESTLTYYDEDWEASGWSGTSDSAESDSGSSKDSAAAGDTASDGSGSGENDASAAETVSDDDDSWKSSFPADTVYLVYNEELLSYFGQSVFSVADYLETYSDYSLGIISGEKQVTLAVDPDRMEELLAFQEQILEREAENFAGLGEDYKVEFTADRCGVDLYYDDQIDDSAMAQEAVYCFMTAVTDQLIRTCDGENWKLHVQIFNCHTGEQTEDENIPDVDENLYITSHTGW